MDLEPRDSQKSAYTYSDYYTTGGRCPPPKRPKNSGGWTAMVLGILLLCASSLILLHGTGKSAGTRGMDAAAGSAEELVQATPEVLSEQTAAESTVSAPAGAEAPEAVPEQAAVSLSITQTPGKELSLPELYKKVIPSVASITALSSTAKSTGTGIVMSQDGYLITNYHVVSGAEAITVLLSDEQEYTATLVGGDETSDLAVLKISARNLTPAEFGDSDAVEVGDAVVAIGDPLGTELRGTMTDGIICGINRDVQVGDRTMTLMQTNAALNAGNSGGPLVNMSGQVIGINTMKLSSSYTPVEGIGFAIPISDGAAIIDELVEKGYVSGRPAFGFTVETLPAQMRLFYSLPGALYVRSVTEDAAAQGISEGDVIIAIDGEYVSSLDEFNTVKNQHSAGDSVSLTVFRKGEELELTLTLVDRATLG